MTTVPTTPNSGYTPQPGDRIDLAIRNVVVDDVDGIDLYLKYTPDNDAYHVDVCLPTDMPGLTVAPAEPDQTVWTWMATARRGLEAHRLTNNDRDAALTICGRSTRTGIRLDASEARERYAAGWCIPCWPHGDPTHTREINDSQPAGITINPAEGPAITTPDQAGDNDQTPGTLAVDGSAGGTRSPQPPAEPTKARLAAEQLRGIAARLEQADDTPNIRVSWCCGYPNTAAKASATMARVDALAELLDLPRAAMVRSGSNYYEAKTTHAGIQQWVYCVLPDSQVCTCGRPCDHSDGAA